MLSAVKDILTKEVDVKEFLEMEIELTKLKELLETEIKLKEFLVQEIDLNSFASNKAKEDLKAANKKVAPKATVEKAKAAVIEAKQQHDSRRQEQKTKRDLPAYDYTLIETLHAEHKEIRFIYNRLMSFTVEKDYAKVAGLLETFNSEIREHYKRADANLYGYLRTYVQIKYPQREKAFAQLSLEMKNLSIEIFYIISQSPNIPLSEKTYSAFLKEFMAVGKLMNERINREKDMLFKMYEQTNAAKSIS